MGNVMVIPAKRQVGNNVKRGQKPKLRVAAYCRVSTDSDEQATSYEAQIEHYTEYISKNPDWVLAGIFADEGITGTNTKKRTEFNRMIDECMDGNIDMIITKSISRFARNTLDCLKYIRQLKEKNIPVFFEKESINTMDSKGEVLLTIMASLAQQESQSLSQNIKLGLQYRYQQGHVQVNHNRFLGYTKDADGHLIIDPNQAEIVRRIYREYLEGFSMDKIAAGLERDGVLTGAGKVKWHTSTINKILRNEKYMGDALLQKTYTTDFLTKKRIKNNGTVPQYYVEDSHPAIIEPWEWEQVQVELERRKNSRNRHHQTSPFSGKIICADCGDIFGAKTWHSTDRYRRVIWQCNGKFKGEHKCETPHLTEERLKELYLAALGEYLSDRDAAIDQLRYAQRMLTDTDFIDEDIQALEEELTTITGMLRLCIAENAANTMTEETYRTTHAELCSRFEETEAKLAALQKQRDKMKADAITIGGMMFELGELDSLPLTFDEKLWHGTIDHVTVHADERVVFHFKDGNENVTRL